MTKTSATVTHQPAAAAAYSRPGRFYLWATAVPWALWFPAAWASRQGAEGAVSVAVLGVLGLLAPLGVVAWMTRSEPGLRRDMARRLVNFREVGPVWLLLACGLMPGAILVATAISVLLGYSPDQFGLRDAVTFSTGLLPGWVVLVLAPVVEELAWHSYGTDALRTRFSMFTASLLFAVIWALWHLPLAFIAGTSQSETAGQGLWHALNFPVSMVPFVLLMNWIYYRSGRNITVTILFHLAANLITQVLATHPDTEVMATGVLLVATALVLWFERALFFAPAHEASSSRLTLRDRVDEKGRSPARPSQPLAGDPGERTRRVGARRRRARHAAAAVARRGAGARRRASV